jgi:hypothetical protein
VDHYFPRLQCSGQPFFLSNLLAMLIHLLLLFHDEQGREQLHDVWRHLNHFFFCSRSFSGLFSGNSSTLHSPPGCGSMFSRSAFFQRDKLNRYVSYIKHLFYKRIYL